MQFTAKQIASKLKGTVEGDENVLIWKPCRIEEVDEGGITFLANPKYTHYIYERKAAAILIAKDFVLEHPVDATLIRVDNPYLCVAKVLHMFNTASKPKRGRKIGSHVAWSAKVGKNCYIGEYAVISRKAKIGNNVQIYPQVYIGDYAEVGDNTILYPGVKIYRECKVGKNCILHAGVVIGADGFGFAPTGDGSYNKIDQIGNVIIEDDVELGANTCVDRATMGSTIVHKGVKLDNLCQIAHNVSVGANTVMASQTGCAGSTKIGENCVLAGQVGVVGHIKVGNRVTVAAQSGVTRNIDDDAVVLGSPAMPADKQRKVYVMQRKLEEMYKDIAELKKKLQ
ncbi:MAG: UDP-3-O-(3-hydroxymyristoyl)glucosamine N-acyltransferase [Bacteroidales bacterium]|nr:UDP-3-O-(3-hydroxymyristoyl)glucosamine N-acyltransferase [Bacteroidales bacterium]